MNFDEVHQSVKRTMGTTVKICEASIEYYEQRIKELKLVIQAAQRAGADEILPRNAREADTLGTLAAITNALEQEAPIPTPPLRPNKSSGAIPSPLLTAPHNNHKD